MNIKIVIIFVCMLLIWSTTTLALIPLSKNEQEKKYQFFVKTPVPLPPPKRWMKTFGGIENDIGYSVQQTSDGGYIITGRTTNNYTYYSDVLLIKTDSNGNKIWNKTFGETNYDSGMSVQQTTDGGYIIAGFSEFDSSRCGDFLLIKTDDDGNKMWDRTFGGTEWDEGYSVQQTTDGGYIITGGTWSFGSGLDDVWLIKTDSNGSKEWDRTFGETGYDFGQCVQQTTDGGYIITGTTDLSSFDNADVLLIKTDTNGNEKWTKRIGVRETDIGMSVQQTTDGGYIITGSSKSYGTREDIVLIKTNNNGNKTWDKFFGGPNEDCGWSVKQTTDGGYIITGYTLSFDVGNGDVWLIKTDGDGNEQWNRTFGGTGYDLGMSVQRTVDKGYIIVGSTTSFGAGCFDVWLIKTDCQGKSKTVSLDTLWFERLFQRFPHAFPLLRHLMGY